MRHTKKIPQTLSILLAAVIMPFLVTGCDKGNANGQQTLDAVPIPSTPSDMQALSKATLDAQIVIIRQAEAIDVTNLRVAKGTDKQPQEGESLFGNIFVSNDMHKKRLSSALHQELLNWMSIDRHFDHLIEKRCSSAASLGLDILLDSATKPKIRVVIDPACRRLHFYETDGAFIFLTHYDPSHELVDALLKKITSE